MSALGEFFFSILENYEYLSLHKKKILDRNDGSIDTVVPVVEETFVEHLQVLGIPGEGEAVSGHGVPRSNG